MPKYIILLSYTDQGIKNIKESPQRVAAARKAIESAGGKMDAFYLTMGQYDAVAIGAQGNIRTTTLKAFNEDEMAAIISSVP